MVNSPGHRWLPAHTANQPVGLKMSSCFCLLPVPELNGAVKPCFRAVFAAAPPQLLFCHVCRAEGTPPLVGQEAWTLEVNRVLMSAVILWR